MRVLPAHAGVILWETPAGISTTSITRTCGGDPVVAIEKTDDMMYYPHMRGWS